MGCCTSKKPIKSEMQSQKNQIKEENASIILEENFKIVDFTQSLEKITQITDSKDLIRINNYFPSYFPSEIKCVKLKFESRSDHSHLIVIFSCNDDEKPKELVLVTDYNRFGFTMRLGETKWLKETFELKGSLMEFLLFPKSDNVTKITIGEILEWAFLHKDEEYKSPDVAPELNMAEGCLNLFQINLLMM